MSLQSAGKFILLAVWLTTCAWLIRFEAYPHWFDDHVNGYRDMMRNLPAVRDTWMKVMADGRHVGYVNSTIELTDKDGEEYIKLNSQLHVRLQLNGEEEILRMETDVLLNARQQMVKSTSSAAFGTFSLKLDMIPLDKPDLFEVVIQLNGMEVRRNVALPEGVIISTPLLDTGLRSVRAGRKVSIRAMNPFSLSGKSGTIEVEGVSTSMRRLPGERNAVEITNVKMTVGQWILHAEVDEHGRIVRQETPFGVTFLLSEAGDAMNVPDGNSVDPSTLLDLKGLPSVFNLPGLL